MIGSNDGSALVYNMQQENFKKLEYKKQMMPVEDVSFDPLSDKYVLVAYKDGAMVLYDFEGPHVLTQFERQGAGIKCIAWNKAVPGEFFTSSDKIAALRVWSVSKTAPVDTLKLGRSGMRQILYLDDRNSLICAFKNGSVGVYSITKKKLEFCTEPGHAETVFDVQINPRDKNMLATASYDGTVKLWDIRTMKNIETLESDALEQGQFKGVLMTKNVLYGVAFGPNNLIATATVKGDVLLFDYRKLRLLHRMRPCPEGPIFRISWSPLNDDKLAVGTSDQYLIVLQIVKNKLEVVNKIRHPHTVFGIAWHPTRSDIIATACQDCRVRVYNLNNPSEPEAFLRGHEGRVFNVVWHPTLDHILASSSDDKTVIIWDTQSQTIYRKLEGHTENTRAIAWNSELPYIVLTGSWDSTIRMWDIRTGNCLYVAKDHHADIYGLCTHYERPFLYVSCSRDTSIRFWSLEELVGPLVLKSITSGELSTQLGMPSLDISASNVLCGKGSRELVEKLGDMNEVERYESLLSFFSYHSGEEDFFDMINYILNNKPCRATNQIIPVEELCAVKRSRATELETASGMAFLGSALAKKEDRLSEAAKIYLKLGNIKQYCEIMIKLKKWEQALAFAPGFSIEYWHNVAGRYAQQLAQHEKEEAGAVYLASGKVDKAIQYYLKRRDNQDALLVASVKSAGGFNEMTSAEVSTGKPLSMSEADHNVLREITSQLANDFFVMNEPVLSAAAHLSLKDSSAAYHKLIRAHELYYALVLAKLFRLPHDELLEMLARRAERYREFEIGVRLLESTPDLKELFVSRASTPDRHSFYQQMGIRSPQEYSAFGEKCLADRKLKEAVRNFVVAGYTDRACEVSLHAFRSRLQSGEGLEELFTIWRYLGYLRLESLPVRIKAEILAAAALLGAVQAWWKGLPVVSCLVGTFNNLVRHQNLDFPVSPGFSQMVFILNEAARDATSGKAQIEASMLNLPSRESTALQHINQYIGKENNYKEYCKNSIRLVGTNLPANNMQANPPVSVFTRRVIQGVPFYLQDGIAIGLDEALMWARVNPFSPLNDGSVVNPY